LVFVVALLAFWDEELGDFDVEEEDDRDEW
jgi:hypothetical protein